MHAEINVMTIVRLDLFIVLFDTNCTCIIVLNHIHNHHLHFSCCVATASVGLLHIGNCCRTSLSIVRNSQALREYCFRQIFFFYRRFRSCSMYILLSKNSLSKTSSSAAVIMETSKLHVLFLYWIDLCNIFVLCIAEFFVVCFWCWGRGGGGGSLCWLQPWFDKLYCCSFVRCTFAIFCCCCFLAFLCFFVLKITFMRLFVGLATNLSVITVLRLTINMMFWKLLVV